MIVIGTTLTVTAVGGVAVLLLDGVPWVGLVLCAVALLEVAWLLERVDGHSWDRSVQRERAPGRAALPVSESGASAKAVYDQPGDDEGRDV